MDGRRSGSTPSYCSNCGEKVSSSDNFCSSCGSELAPESESIADRDVLEYRISKAIEAGWELEYDFGDHAVMKRRNFGDSTTHLLIAILTFWLTVGMGNVIYAAYCYVSASDRMLLRADGVKMVRSPPEDTIESHSWSGAVGAALLLWLGAFFVGLIALGFSGTWPLAIPFAIAAVALALGGVGVLPPARRRLENRRSITTNGTVRSVEERSCSDPDEPCAVCGTSIRRGVERTYEKEFCLLGVPLRTAEKGTNYYCEDCATRDGHRPTGYEGLDIDGVSTGPEGSPTLEDVLVETSETGDAEDPDAIEEGTDDENRDREREPDTA